MHSQIIRLDTFIKTFALRPVEVAHWLLSAKRELDASRPVTYTLTPEMSITKRIEQITLISE